MMTSSNNSSMGAHRHIMLNEQLSYQIIRLTVLSTVLLLSVIGNGSLIIILMYIRNTKKLSDRLILNLAVCNLLLTLFSIPTGLVVDSSTEYPFGGLGCKIISPIATYASNSGVITLLVIAFERWNIVCKPFTIYSSERKQRVTIAIIHVIGFIPVIPYINTLEYTSYQNSNSCSEVWNLNSRRIYTASLFTMQYALPVVFMAYFYISAWIALAKSNERAITSLESSLSGILISSNNKTQIKSCKNVDNYKECSTIQQSCASNQSTTLKHDFHKIKKSKNNTLKLKNAKCKNKSKLYRKARQSSKNNSNKTQRDNSVIKHLRISTNNPLRSANVSQNNAIAKRYQQSYLILRMFSVIVVIFVIFMLPNQILWLLIDFKGQGDEHFNDILHDVVYVLTYANCVLNPLIYGGYNKPLRKDFRYFFRKMLSVIICRNNFEIKK